MMTRGAMAGRRLRQNGWIIAMLVKGRATDLGTFDEHHELQLMGQAL